MKRFLTVVLCLITLCLSFAFSACGGGDKDTITVCMPDGAPALSMAKFMAEDTDFGRKVEYRVVGSSEIASCVTNLDETKNADLCILPVNTASKLVGDGTKYKMLGTVTHGNLFIAAAADAQDLTRDNFAEEIAGKKVGVVNLPAFPGAVFKLLLSDYGVSDKVMLSPVAATEVSGTDGGYDYFVIPEPVASVRVGNANLKLKIAGSLQNLYGEDGYPQAVLVAKASLIENDGKFISKFMEEMTAAADWLTDEGTSASTIITAIAAHYPDPENTAPAFNEKNLTKTVIANCAVKFTGAETDKDKIVEFLRKLKAAGDAAATEVAESFFYNGSK